VDKQIALVLAFFPLVAFIIAAVTELRFSASNLTTIRNLLPPVLGIAAFWFLWNPDAVFPLPRVAEIWFLLSRVMAIFSAAIACSGVFIPYSQRSTSRWMACGGLVLALMWLFGTGPIVDSHRVAVLVDSRGEPACELRLHDASSVRTEFTGRTPPPSRARSMARSTTAPHSHCAPGIEARDSQSSSLLPRQTARHDGAR